MTKHQKHAAVTDGHGHALPVRNFAFVEHPTQDQDQGGVEVQDEPFKRRTDVLQP